MNSLNNSFAIQRDYRFSQLRAKKKSRPWAGMLPERIETPRRGESFKKCDLVTREIRAAKQPNWTGRAYTCLKLSATTHTIKLLYFILTFLYRVIFIEKINLVLRKNNRVMPQVWPQPLYWHHMTVLQQIFLLSWSASMHHEVELWE